MIKHRKNPISQSPHPLEFHLKVGKNSNQFFMCSQHEGFAEKNWNIYFPAFHSPLEMELSLLLRLPTSIHFLRMQ